MSQSVHMHVYNNNIILFLYICMLLCLLHVLCYNNFMVGKGNLLCCICIRLIIKKLECKYIKHTDKYLYASFIYYSIIHR